MPRRERHRPPIAVTGGAGGTGSHVTAALVVDDLSTGRVADGLAETVDRIRDVYPGGPRVPAPRPAMVH